MCGCGWNESMTKYYTCGTHSDTGRGVWKNRVLYADERFRVHEISFRIGIPSRTLLATCQLMGMRVNSASSSLSLRELHKILDFYDRAYVP